MSEWTQVKGYPDSQHARQSVRMFLFAHEAKDGTFEWTAAASRFVESLRWQKRRVDGHAATLDDAKVAAETMGRRMRKVLRWAR